MYSEQKTRWQRFGRHGGTAPMSDEEKSQSALGLALAAIREKQAQMSPEQLEEAGRERDFLRHRESSVAGYVLGLFGCEQCDGLGVVSVPMPPGHHKTNELIPCECRQEADAQRKTWRLEDENQLSAGLPESVKQSVAASKIYTAMSSSGLLDEWQSYSLDDLQARPGRDAIEGVAVEFLNTALSIPPYGFLTITGPWGIGKSWVGKAIVADCARRGVNARYSEASVLQSELYRSIGHPSTSPESVVDELVKLPILVIDEISFAHTNQFAMSHFYTMFNMRYEMAGRRATLVIASDEFMATGGESLGMGAFYSRMRGGTVAKPDSDVRDIRKQLGEVVGGRQ